jgi:prepilin-type N-terminal cleavage/methylation domain-containing protein
MISPRHYNFAGQRGVTLTELLIVIIIIAVVSTFALMQGGSANAQFQRQNIARELKVAFERARFDSVKRRADVATNQAKVVINSTSFVLWTDTNMNGTPDAAEAVTTNFSTQNITVTTYANGVTLPITVSYNQRGEVTATNAGGNVSPVFLVCNGTCDATNDNTGNANIILVTATGTVNLLGGGSTPPNFNAPANLSAVPTNTDVSNLVRIP